jgi:hypothetical protein
MVRTYSCKFNGDTAPALVGRLSEWRPAYDLRALGAMARIMRKRVMMPMASRRTDCLARIQGGAAFNRN